jgi:breast cancer 2 susceptibility protein
MDETEIDNKYEAQGDSDENGVERPLSPNPFTFVTDLQTFRRSTIDTREDVSLPSFASASSLPGFASASSRPNSALAPSAAALERAKKLQAQWDSDFNMDVESNRLAADANFSGFSTASNKGFILPSAAAIASAERKRKQWDGEIDEFPEEGNDEDNKTSSRDAVITQMPTFARASTTAESVTPFKTPFKPPSTSHSIVGAPPTSQPSALTSAVSGFLTSTPTPSVKGFSTPVRSMNSGIAMRPITPISPGLALSGSTLKAKSKAFKSPLLPATGIKVQSTPLRPRTFSHGPPSSQQSLPASQNRSSTYLNAPPSTPDRPSCPRSIYATPPQKSTESNPKSSNKLLFSTPFKAGMRPGEPGRLRLEQEQEEARKATRKHIEGSMPLRSSTTQKGKERGDYQFFDLRVYRLLMFSQTGSNSFISGPPAGRQSLESCGMVPQTYTEDELQTKGM